MTDDRHKVLQPYSVRLSAELRERLEAAAKKENRTLHQEVILRLERSLEAEKPGKEDDGLYYSLPLPDSIKANDESAFSRLGKEVFDMVSRRMSAKPTGRRERKK